MKCRNVLGIVNEIIEWNSGTFSFCQQVYGTIATLEASEKLEVILSIICLPQHFLFCLCYHYLDSRYFRMHASVHESMH